MKIKTKPILSLCFVLGLSTILVCCVAGSNGKIPENAKRTKQLINRINKFCIEELGISKTINFQKYKKNVKTTYTLVLAPINRLYYDYTFNTTKNRKFDDIEEAKKESDAIKEKYDTYIYRLDGHAGEYPLTDPFLSLSTTRQIFLIIHEDWHDNISFSRSLEEATGNLLGYLGTIKFLKESHADTKDIKEAEATLKWTKEKARIVTHYYNILEELYNRQNIDEAEIKRERSLIFTEAQKECADTEKRTGALLSNLDFNNAALSNWITYDRYFDLVWRVYIYTGKNLKETARIFRKIAPLPSSVWSDENKIKEYEKEAVKYLEGYAVPKKITSRF
ncbi:MAG: hypothetical protein COU46_00420 [Candidatus Niyogibacteria bacterium CG10_big_fil_rev_8_21_14_0_10_42_19]|uniref:Uncharacterized protein n=1 Tax=Candidatus Niyogibacteria bacterium CG10_big_fil_rev_8_21_14_0_10_42_19 TaxID=1974725 RepID=A0A2H0TGE8_9BACT|nr:MAG: hypothetical protein COU46_00420 [Candidatus Niyogibacteria bacterium CG10_big_fil_rev_8_21_14_0_10_42_19]